MRYLARTFPSTFEYESQDPKKSCAIDNWIDRCNSEVVFGDNNSVDRFVKDLESHIAKKGLLFQESNIASFAVWSALENYEVATPASIKRWLKDLSNKSKVEVKKRPRSDSVEIVAEFPKGKKKNGKVDSVSEGRREILEYFDKLGIEYENIEHPEAFTVDQMLPHLTHVKDGALTKNLFLKDKKKNLYLLCALFDREVNLGRVGKLIKAKDLRFADENVLFDKLCVRQGCVTAYSLYKDSRGDVKFLADKSLVDGSFEKVYFHPMVNDCTTGIRWQDFKKFVNATGHEIVMVDFS